MERPAPIAGAQSPPEAAPKPSTAAGGTDELPRFLQVVGDVALDTGCAQLVAKRGPLFYRGDTIEPKPIRNDTRLAAFDGQEACVVEEPEPLAVALSTTGEGEPPFRCQGYSLLRCRRLNSIDVAVLGSFQSARTWAREAIWHLEVAEYQAKDQAPPEELIHRHEPAPGYRVLQRQHHPNELWFRDELRAQFSETSFPEIDGRRYLLVHGRLVELGETGPRVAFEQYPIRRVPVGDDEY